MEEIWKDIAGYEGLYQVSNLGRVRSLDRTIQYFRQGVLNIAHRKGKLMKQNYTSDGYFMIYLRKDNIDKYYAVHRLVAQAFIPNPDNLPYVNHKDEVKDNNCVDNLEWCTHTYNCNYGTAIERMRQKVTGKPKNWSIQGKKRLSESHKRENLSKETLMKMSASQSGKTRPDWYKQYMHEINSGEFNPNYRGPRQYSKEQLVELKQKLFEKYCPKSNTD